MLVLLGANLVALDNSALFSYFGWNGLLIVFGLGLALAVTGWLGSDTLPLSRAFLIVGALLLVSAIGVGQIWILRPTSQTEVKAIKPTSTFQSDLEVKQRLPLVESVLQNGDWASSESLQLLQRCRKQYPKQISDIERYEAAWYFLHGDGVRGEETLGRLGMENEVASFYEAKGDWESLRRINEGKYSLTGHPTPGSMRTAALLALNRGNQLAQPGRHLVETCLQPGRIRETQIEPLWDQVRVRLGRDISPAEYYCCLENLAHVAEDRTVLSRLFFEICKLEQLHPELRTRATALTVPLS